MVLMEALEPQKKSLVLILLKETQNFVWVYIIRLIIVYLFVNGKEIFKFKTDNKNVNFPTRFYLGSISSGFSKTESEKYL